MAAAVFTNGHAANGTEYRVSNKFHSEPDKIRVISVGAGFSGLCLAYKMQQTMSNYELVCYEKLVLPKQHLNKSILISSSQEFMCWRVSPLPRLRKTSIVTDGLQDLV